LKNSVASVLSGNTGLSAFVRRLPDITNTV
jgi:hypothetical protein